MNNIGINRIVVYNKLPFGKQGFKYFTGYKNTTKSRSLCIFLPKNSVYIMDFYKNECMSFLIKDDFFFLEKYNEIWKNVSNRI